MTVDSLALKAPRAMHDLVVERLSDGPLGDADRQLIEAAAEEVVGLIRTLLPHRDGSLVEAVRRFHDDDWLAGCAFAEMHPEALVRTASARRVVREQVDAAFGHSPAEELMRAAIAWAYLDPSGGHVTAQRELHVSRATFYRTLRRARARLGDTV